MDCIYCAISFTGFSSFFDHGIVKASMQVFSFVFLLFLGLKFLGAQTVKVPTKLDATTEKIEARLEKKLHPHSAFMTGFVRVLANLGVFVAWIVLSANLMSHDWVDDSLPAKAACIVGVFTGYVLWFLIFSYGVSRSHGRFSEKTLLRLQHLSGICLIAAGIFDGINIAWHLARHKI
jgi:threonine/homoserine/homoserine lactone efflux protein